MVGVPRTGWGARQLGCVTIPAWAGSGLTTLWTLYVKESSRVLAAGRARDERQGVEVFRAGTDFEGVRFQIDDDARELTLTKQSQQSQDQLIFPIGEFDLS